ncbi:Short chain dehydrogenase family protein [gamma proteobacterium HdN1]|nr:Short chain dehydrogenase family protein [gamma proteobacterium HdN1]
MNILITGASSGLGLGMAREFAAKGHSLALCARRLEELEKTRAELLAAYPAIRVSVRALDVTQYDQVFEVFKAFAEEFGTLDRIIINAGIGKGQPLGTGRFDANLDTAKTNFVAALAQCEAAMQIFRAQNAGHLVAISSISALRGLPKNLSVYAATKAALASLTEGLRLELMGTPIRVTTIYPGYIRTDINRFAAKLPFEVDEVTGSRAIVAAIESGKAEAYVPKWPWSVLGVALKHLPLSVLKKVV